MIICLLFIPMIWYNECTYWENALIFSLFGSSKNIYTYKYESGEVFYMEELLRSSELRRLQIALNLYDKDDWMTIPDLAKKMNVSIRILKYDLHNFNTVFDDFTLETSHHGVRLIFHKDKSLKTLFNNVLVQSTPFQLLETIFFNEHYSTFELADHLFVSPSTLYRMIDHINTRLEQYDFQIMTNPCRFSGDEYAIRSFFINLFYEKYTQLDWVYKDYEDEIENLVYFILEVIDFEVDFALFNIYILTTTVNFIRFKQNHLLLMDESHFNTAELLDLIEEQADALPYFEENLKIVFNLELLKELFLPIVYKEFSISQERLEQKMRVDKTLAKSAQSLSQLLDELSERHHLPLINKDEIIFGLMNAAATKKFDPRAGFILHDRNQHFIDVVFHEFPEFYKDLRKGIHTFLKIRGLSLDEENIIYLMYIAYADWKGLTLNLRKAHEKIKILVISNRHPKHSNMIKEFIDYELSDHLEIDIFDDIKISKTILEKLEYDFIIANFPLPILESKNCLCIENIPTFQDLQKIRHEIDTIYKQRLNGTGGM